MLRELLLLDENLVSDLLKNVLVMSGSDDGTRIRDVALLFAE